MRWPFEQVDAGGIRGELYLPETPGPWPSVVILNSSAGLCDTRERFYARFFAARGLAALAVDSFGPRGLRETTGDQGRFDDRDMERDAFAAHDLLAAEGRFAPDRIAVMGVSKGGLAALNTGMLARRTWLGRSGPDFCRRAALCPPAHMQMRDARTDGRPLLVLLAGLDDYTGVAGPLAYVERLRAAGALVAAEVLPGAHHAFERLGPPLFLAQAENFAHMLFFVEDDGSITEAASGERMSREEYLSRRGRWRRLGGHAGGGTAELRGQVAARLLRFFLDSDSSTQGG